KPHDGEALTSDVSGSFKVVRFDAGVRVAVEFDDKSFLGAVEVGYIRADDVLSAKLPRLKPPPTKMPPKNRLRGRHVPPQLAGAAGHVRVNVHYEQPVQATGFPPHPIPLPRKAGGEGEKRAAPGARSEPRLLAG